MVTPTKQIMKVDSIIKNCEVSELSHVSVKLPSFTSLRLLGCFLRTEAQFELSETTQERTKFNYLLSAIPEESLYKVPDYSLKKSLKSELPYSDFKVLLTRHCQESKVWDLIDEISKDKTDFKDTLVKHMVLNCIPTSSRQHLTQGFSRLLYEEFIKCARTGKNARTLKLSCYLDKEGDVDEDAGVKC
ncbi:unnamed protein product [Lepeophtheirus salmonis]|uniref:(salmon louse) hypothetical protein n=1 Tax=Lepeophtheirus salmonis TaxID=72036 RepID=A0A7R8CW89_LEPSM|nr:unnamed protein product [Lepeophtheirus salmonis]CAF2949869.1 unnamed protein product [Lepeophtheirus salmonis]